MDIERLLGLEVETPEGTKVGQIIGIEIYGPKINIIIDPHFDFHTDGGPDGGEELSKLSDPDTPPKDFKVVNLGDFAGTKTG